RAGGAFPQKVGTVRTGLQMVGAELRVEEDADEQVRERDCLRNGERRGDRRAVEVLHDTDRRSWPDAHQIELEQRGPQRVADTLVLHRRTDDQARVALDLDRRVTLAVHARWALDR